AADFVREAGGERADVSEPRGLFLAGFAFELLFIFGGSGHYRCACLWCRLPACVAEMGRLEACTTVSLRVLAHVAGHARFGDVLAAIFAFLRFRVAVVAEKFAAGRILLQAFLIVISAALFFR